MVTPRACSDALIGQIRSEPEVESSRTLWWLVAVLLVAMLVASLVGRYPVTVVDTLGLIRDWLNASTPQLSIQGQTVLLFVRWPRVLIAVLVGVSLSIAGTAFQGLFRNAIVSPDLLGASSGAGFGASLAILNSCGLVTTQLTAFAFGIVAVLLAYMVSLSFGRGTLALLLSGVAVTALFTAFTSMTKLVADPENKLPAITFWLMGGLTNVTHRDLLVLLSTTAFGGVPLFLLRWQLNIVALGEDSATALGVSMSRMQSIIVASATLLTASSVAICGMIGWVGLLVPNMARALVGPRFDRLLPTSMALGGLFVLVVDTIARSLWTTEVPLGILFSLLGAPFLLVMLHRQKVDL